MQKIQILLVEDHYALRPCLVEILEEEGYGVQAVESLDGMTEALKTAIPHLAILDFRFPRAPGLRLENLGFEAQDMLEEVGVPVLGMSAMPRPLPEGLKPFGDESIPEGFSIEEFLTAVQRMLEKGVGGGA